MGLSGGMGATGAMQWRGVALGSDASAEEASEGLTSLRLWLAQVNAR
jgi:hypothetical protein